MATPGRDVVVLAEVTAGNFQVIAEQTSLDISRGKNQQTVEHKDASTAVVVGGTKTQSLSFDSLRVRADIGQDFLRNAYDTDDEITIRLEFDGQDIEEWVVKVTQYNESAPVGDFATVSVQLDPVDDPIKLA